MLDPPAAVAAPSGVRPAINARFITTARPKLSIRHFCVSVPQHTAFCCACAPGRNSLQRPLAAAAAAAARLVAASAADEDQAEGVAGAENDVLDDMTEDPEGGSEVVFELPLPLVRHQRPLPMQASPARDAVRGIC